ncbi:MAG: ATP-binding protein [Myxococcota bacterium]
MTAERAADLVQLEWLTRLRWTALATQLALVVTVALVADVGVSWLAAGLVLGAGVASNFALEVAKRRPGRVTPAVLTRLFALDVLLLTVLLEASGGPQNPFSLLYLVPVALATVALPSKHSAFVAALAAVGFALLFWLGEGTSHLHHGGAGMALHLRGMGVALAVTAGFIWFFAGRMREALSEAREAEQKTRRLAALATLAGGAAHELATPLSTIAVIAFELQDKLRSMNAPDSVLEDVRLALGQVDRCRDILSRMSADAGEALGERPRAVVVAEVVEEAVAELAGKERVATEVMKDAASLKATLPRRALVQALVALLKNALEAGPGPVGVRLSAQAGAVVIEVKDQGAGMSPETLSHLGEPFFSTKPTGKGLGLGIFLARTLVERFGGALLHRSEPGKGTLAELRLPIEGTAG